jgi:hypothetical protein
MIPPSRMWLNLDPLRADSPNADAVAALGTGCVRVSIRPNFDWRGWINWFHSFGVVVAAGCFAESLAGSTIETAANHWAAEIGDLIDVLLLCNEADGATGGASQSMSQADVNHWLGVWAPLFQARNPNVRIIAPALITGNENWPVDGSGVDLHRVNGIDLHAYGEGVGIQAFLQRYRYLKQPFLLGEWWPNATATTLALEAKDVLGVAWWWHQPPDTDAALGIKDDPVKRAAFKSLAAKFPNTIPGGSTVAAPAFKLGFADYAAAHPEIGKALSEEAYLLDSNGAGQLSLQLSEGGLLAYAKATNETRLMPASPK